MKNLNVKRFKHLPTCVIDFINELVQRIEALEKQNDALKIKLEGK